MAPDEKVVLVISYHFPPSGSTGAIRPAKFVKYLPAAGWRPVVLTVRSGYDFGVPEDSSLLADLPADVTVVRTPSWEPLNAFERWRDRRRASASSIRHGNGVRHGRSNSGSCGGPLKATKGLVTSLLATPDRYLGWLPFAVTVGTRIIREHGVRILVSSAPPITSHLVAWALKFRTGLPWVADFRDPWTQNYGFEQKPWWWQRVAFSLEKRIMRHADRVVTVSAPLLDGFTEKYVSLPREKFRVVTNGFDPADFEGTADEPTDRLTIRHLGNIYGRQTSMYFLEALARVAERRPNLKAELSVEFVGSVDIEKSHESLLARLDGVVRISSRVPRKQATALMQSADALLLLVGKGKVADGCYTTKLFEYLYSRKWILGLVPEGVAADLVRKAHAGHVVDPEKVPEIEKALLEMLDRYRAGTLNPNINGDVISEFDRRRLARGLAEIMVECVEPGSRANNQDDDG